MNKEIIKIFEVNTDAIATNRGFYYQYLVVLKKWINNYINNKDLATATEVDDDIKEIGEELIFTQVKCYTSSFSLHSTEVKKALFNFYLLYLKHLNLNEKTSFHFTTNTKISTKEKLLLRWVQEHPLRDGELLTLCTNKIETILSKEFKIRKNKLLSKVVTSDKKDEVKIAYESIIEEINSNSTESFVKSINWDFKSKLPEDAIDSITNEIYELLENSKFGKIPRHLLFSSLLSEIYRASQRKVKADRFLTNDFIDQILSRTNDEITELIDKRFTKLLNIEIESLKLSVNEIRKTQDLQFEEIKTLKENLKSKRDIEIKELNILPDFSSIEVFDWDNFLDEVSLSLNDKKTLSISAPGGMGKTTFGKKFLSAYYEKYNHIIWLGVEGSIQSSFILDSALRQNLQEIKAANNENDSEVFKLILSKLNALDGINLLILDIQNSVNEISELQNLGLSKNWEKLILTRTNLKTIPNTKLPKITFSNLKKIYLKNCTAESSDELLKKLFSLVGYNILVVELIAKTIHNSFDLTLESFLESYSEQSLNQTKFKIDIDIASEDEPIKIFSYLLEKFSLPNLKSNEKNYLDFLALLPSNNIIIEDLILINGKDFYEKNKVEIINILNSLDKKGILVVSEDRKKFDIHKIIREVIIYKQREGISPFISNMFSINWLIRRIEEGYNEPQNSFRFLRYAESILDSIKEEYRQSIYQPLLLLENEFLYAKRFYTGAKSNLNKLIDLANRASKYTPLNKNNLGVIYNNLGLCYAENDEKDLAILYFEKALESYVDNDKSISGYRIVTLNNLSNIYLLDNDLPKMAENFKKVQKIRKQYQLYDDQQLSIEYRILSKSYSLVGDYEKAIKFLREGIKLHESLNKNQRNDFYLAAYHNELSNLFLTTDEFIKAIDHQEKGIKILEDMGLNNSSYLLTMYEISRNLYRYLNLEEKETLMKEKIKLFKAYES
ncbi:tetratricopeptide repeat protein [Aquimarina sp. TRL1]|uniref:tetratricopeptide repeat protein n=1 Tax=Aquimarina sp. (strain TRL1) TaxID=2736252 RepID=UPI00158DAEFB|nr:tetratricopeptide repeat protein [Aquimarina sp. TRL1]QKX05404.1 tetratricopeptide repeat protein [Aquimarina sp. TRL1]